MSRRDDDSEARDGTWTVIVLCAIAIVMFAGLVVLFGVG